MAKKSLYVQQDCIIGNRPCGRVFGGSNTCFVACPTSEEVGFEIAIIKAILDDEELEPYIAVEHFEPAKDIFCTKICTKIIEAKFCIVVLSGVTDEHGIVQPNPNVYYEYGLMTSWRKHIVPVQRVDQKLAFNIQSLDTIKYTPSSFKDDLTKHVRLTISSLDDLDEEAGHREVEHTLTLYFELNGLAPQRKAWTTAETSYLCFEAFNFGRVVHLAKEVQRVYYDTKVIIRRLERFIQDIDRKIYGVKKSHEMANTDAQKEGTQRQITKLERTREYAGRPHFTVIVMQPELKDVTISNATIEDTSLHPQVTVLTYQEMDAELRKR